jgi:cytochrome c551/c552
MRDARALAVAALAAWLGLAAAPPASAQAPGDPERGRLLFADKACASCHRPRGEAGIGPSLEELRRPQGGFELAGRLWNHAPAMFAALSQRDLGWPEISAAEMGDLMAYLRADPARDPAPDLFKGQVALLRKGCLKCHALRGEGARVGPDLADRGADYASATIWATKMWMHTPRMAATARERGVLFPRFTGDELGDLLGFLRGAAR